MQITAKFNCPKNLPPLPSKGVTFQVGKFHRCNFPTILWDDGQNFPEQFFNLQLTEGNENERELIFIEQNDV